MHFSCVTLGVHKPSWYDTHLDFMTDLHSLAPGCVRFYFLEVYLALLRKAGLDLDPPLWTGPPVPVFNATHDLLQATWREQAHKERGF